MAGLSGMARALLLGFVALRLAFALGRLLVALGLGLLLALARLLVHLLLGGARRLGRVRLRGLRERRQRERRGNEGNDQLLQHKRSLLVSGSRSGSGSTPYNAPAGQRLTRACHNRPARNEARRLH